MVDGNLPTQKIAAAILAGGGASRHGGTPKGLLPIAPGVSIIDHEIRQLTGAGLDEIIIVANEPEPYRQCGPPIISDLRPDIGPLGGIEAALAHCAATCDATLILPCDLPGITQCEMIRLKQAFLESSARAVVAVSGGSFWQSLCLVVHNAALPVISQAIDAGQRRPLLVWRELGATAVHFDEAAPFFNVNTPQDLAHWRATRGRTDERRAGRSRSLAGTGH